MDTTENCYWCGTPLESHQQICPNCGKVQSRRKNTNHSSIPEYSDIAKVAEAMLSGVESFYAKGIITRYNSENYKKYFRRFSIALTILILFGFFIWYKFDWHMTWLIIFITVVIASVTYTHIRRKRHALFFNLVASGYIQMGPNSPLTKYSFVNKNEEQILVRKTWAAKNPKLFKVLNIVISIVIFIVLFILQF